MSETPKRKRLTDAQIGEAERTLAPRPHCKCGMCIDTRRQMHVDHLQAREDRDTAVRLLVDCMTDALPPELAERIRAFVAEVER